MSWSKDVSKGIAQCTACGQPYVVAFQQDGAVRIMGDRDRCICGCEDLERVELSDLGL